jgi:DNA sulfur modification protein DndB
MGDRNYFVAAMRFQEVAERVKEIADVHQSQKLAGWIQRQLDGKHANDIAQYLNQNEERFFNAMVIGVYGGNPQWSELSVGDPRNELTAEDEDRVNRTVGVLTLSGSEKLFPIDGQHRAAGIKKALQINPSLAEEEVAVILVGHAKTAIGLTRTRRLFVTLNQRAKRVSPRDIVALDEDNGLAVVTRRLIDEYSLFQNGEHLSFSGSVNLLPADTKSITSVLGLFQIVKALYPRTSKNWPKLREVQMCRPNTSVLDSMYEFYASYWNRLVEIVPEYKMALIAATQSCDYFRTSSRNHLLFRPAGQLAFARAVQSIMRGGRPMDSAVEILHTRNEMKIQHPTWHHILWDPVSKVMLNKASVAETLLLKNAGETSLSQKALARLGALQGTS